MTTQMVRGLAGPFTLVVLLMALAACSSASPTVSETAACQQLATILNPLLSTSVAAMPSGQQSELYQKAGADLRAAQKTMPRLLRKKVKRILKGVPVFASASAGSMPTPSPSAPPILANVGQPLSGVSRVCATVGVTVGAAGTGAGTPSKS